MRRTDKLILRAFMIMTVLLPIAMAIAVIRNHWWDAIFSAIIWLAMIGVLIWYFKDNDDV